MKIIKYGFLGFILAFTGMISPEVSAQDNTDTERIEELRDKVKSESFNLSTLILVQGDFGFNKDGVAGRRGFNVPQARVKLDGKLDGGFSYKLYADFADEFTLLDAEIGYMLNENNQIIVGAQKPGLSKEFFTGPQNIDFYRRTFVVVALAQERDFGVRLAGDLRGNMNYSLGVFNGNGLARNNDNNFYYVGRLGYLRGSEESGSIEGGLNFSYGEVVNSSIAGGILPNIDGERLTYGGDLRLENENIILATEVLGARLDYIGFTESDNVFGFHLTSGYKIDHNSTILARYETLQSDLLGAGVDQDRILLGFKENPTAQTGFRINYLLPLNHGSEFRDHGIVTTMHIGF
jgi:hypothetical protein